MAKKYSLIVIKTVLSTIENYEKDILAVGYENKTIQTQDKWIQLNIMHIQSLFGTNHRLPLSHMATSYIWLEETNQLINEFSIGYMMNPNFSIDISFKERVKICMKTTFGTMTRQHISKLLSKTNTILLELVMFYDTRNKSKETFQSVELCNV